MNHITARIKDFCDRHFIKVLDANRRYPHSTVHRFTNPLDKDMVIQEPGIESEPLLTIEIPLSRFEKIIAIEHTFFNNIGDRGQRRIFGDWMDQQMAEKHLRDAHPAIKLAYEHYSTLLHLAGKPSNFKQDDAENT